MKPRALFLPLAILFAGAVWLSGQARTIGKLEDGNAELRKSLDQVRARENSASVLRTTGKTALGRRPVDWREVSDGLREPGGFLPGKLRLDAAFTAMNLEEILAALDDLARAELSTRERQRIELRLGDELMRRDPELGLTRFLERDGEWHWLVARHFTKWLDEEPSEAVAWLERQGENGRQIPRQLVAQSFFKTIATQSETSARVLRIIPEEARLESLRSLEVRTLYERGQSEWAEIVRSCLPENDRLVAIAWPTGNWSDGDGSPMLLAEVDAYLTNIAPSPEELEAILLQVATQRRSWRETHREPPALAVGMESLRDWVERHAPELVVPATVKALESSLTSGDAKFPEVAEVALEIHANDPRDELLIPILEKSSPEHRDLAAAVAARLENQALRNTYLQKFAEEP